MRQAYRCNAAQVVEAVVAGRFAEPHPNCTFAALYPNAKVADKTDLGFSTLAGARICSHVRNRFRYAAANVVKPVFQTLGRRQPDSTIQDSRQLQRIQREPLMAP